MLHNVEKLKNKEFILIKKISKKNYIRNNKLIQSIGDDTAITKIQKNSKKKLLITTDMLVENIHFKKKWSTAEQIGIKSIECNISDIASMGGIPLLIFISIGLSKKSSKKWIKNIYKGINKICKKYKVIISGGDIVKNKVSIINITVIGKVNISNLCLRNQASIGDFLAISGNIGNSIKGLKLLSLKLTPSIYLLKKHITPKSNLIKSILISHFTNSMIDITDGLGNEINHICRNSDKSAVIYQINLPIYKKTLVKSKKNNKCLLKLFLNGGEDFELLFTFCPEEITKINKTNIKYHIIGKIIKLKTKPILINKDGNKKNIYNGFTHF